MNENYSIINSINLKIKMEEVNADKFKKKYQNLYD